jgi:hypothetical protein
MAMLVIALVVLVGIGVLAALERVPTHTRKKAGPSF